MCIIKKKKLPHSLEKACAVVFSVITNTVPKSSWPAFIPEKQTVRSSFRIFSRSVKMSPAVLALHHAGRAVKTSPSLCASGREVAGGIHGAQLRSVEPPVDIYFFFPVTQKRVRSSLVRVRTWENTS